MRYFKLNIVPLFFSFVLFPILIVLAQDESKGLVFSEIYLDKNNPNTSWIEIYNPTEETLTLKAIRYSHVKTINMLPTTLQEKGGTSVAPGEYLVISSSKENFPSSMEAEGIIIPELENIKNGGFMALTTEGLDTSGIDIFRFGEPSMSAEFKKASDRPLVNFSTNGKSYSRKITKENGKTVFSNFSESEFTIGY